MSWNNKEVEIYVLGDGEQAEIRNCSHRNTKQLHVSKYLSGPMHYGEDSRSVIRLRFIHFGFCTFTSIEQPRFNCTAIPFYFHTAPATHEAPIVAKDKLFRSLLTELLYPAISASV